MRFRVFLLLFCLGLSMSLMAGEGEPVEAPPQPQVSGPPPVAEAPPLAWEDVPPLAPQEEDGVDGVVQDVFSSGAERKKAALVQDPNSPQVAADQDLKGELGKGSKASAKKPLASKKAMKSSASPKVAQGKKLKRPSKAAPKAKKLAQGKSLKKPSAKTGKKSVKSSTLAKGKNKALLRQPAQKKGLDPKKKNK